MELIANSGLGKFKAFGLTAMFCGVCLSGLSTLAAADTISLKKMTRTPVSELKWKTLPNGRQISPVYGDMMKGAHTTYIKFEPGLKTAPHIHSNDYIGIVVKGTARHYEPGKPETETLLPVGSHWMVPGNAVHISECLTGSECIFAIRQDAAFDRKVVK